MYTVFLYQYKVKKHYFLRQKATSGEEIWRCSLRSRVVLKRHGRPVGVSAGMQVVADRLQGHRGRREAMFKSLAAPISDMNVTLRRPKQRTCERCGRVEQWNDRTESWEISDDATGSIYCIHEWDINGQFVPYDRET